MKLNILIADDHAIVRKGLVQLIREEYPFAQIAEASNSAEVFELIHSQIWDFILLDISMPGRSGVEVLKQIRSMGIKAPILMLSMHPEDQYAIRVLKAGASGFLNKDSATEELIIAMERMLTGRKYITSSLAEKLIDLGFDTSNKTANELLSDREMQVFQLLASGKTVTEIAEDISLSVNTISTYRARVLEKLHLHNNSDITRYALENGFLHSDKS